MRILSILFSLIVGLSLLWHASASWGIGYDPDSIIYEDVAENWIAGDGISRFDFATGATYPMTNFPPLYPMILGIISQIISSVAQSARLLNTLLWAGVWLLMYAWIRRGLQTHWIAWGIATLALINLLVLQVFGTSWSEPLFIVLGLSGFWFIFNEIEQAHWRNIIIASILFACAILTRYAGVTWVATTGLIILFASHRAWQQRIRPLVLLGVISGTPLLLWLLRNIAVRGDVANRDVGFTLVGMPQLESTVQTLGQWIIPIPDLSINLITLAIVTVIFGGMYIVVRRHKQSSDQGIHIMQWWVLIYVIFIIASFTFLDPRIPFNYRILLPAFIGGMIAFGRWLARYWDVAPNYLRLIVQVIGLALLIINGILALNWSRVINQNGQQYSDARFQQSEVIQALRDEPTTAIRYTNNNFLYHYLTDQPAVLLPFAQHDSVASWLENLPDAEIQIVFFHLISQRDWESATQLESLLPVAPIVESDVVSIYELEHTND